jgi:GH18 family chitinase
VQLAQSKHLRGVWAWEISQDDNANDLVKAMTSGAGP